MLGADALLAPLVAKAPGLRSPGHVDGAELALRAVLGQQVSLGAARTHTARLVAAAGTPLPAPDGGLTHLFPEPAAVAELGDARLAMPDRRRQTVRRLAARLAEGTITIDPGTDRAELERQLTALDGVGPWTAAYVALRGLGDPDVFLAGDLGVRRALEQLGQPGDPRARRGTGRVLAAVALVRAAPPLGEPVVTAAPATYVTACVDSPVGQLTVLASAAGLRAILWPGDVPGGRVPWPEDVLDDLRCRPLGPFARSDADHPVIDATRTQLVEYFAGTRRTFALPLDLHGTAFQVKAWQALATIEYGTTTTYGEQARRLGDARWARAVGAANGRNPVSIVLPCHRVVGSNGALTGFAGGLAAKQALLDHEVAVAVRPRSARVPAPDALTARPRRAAPASRDQPGTTVTRCASGWRSQGAATGPRRGAPARCSP